MRTKAIYRPPNNRFVDRMVRRIREDCGLDLLVRGRDSVKASIGALRGGGRLAMLIDQRRSYGMPVPFFGQDAMTGTILAQLALRIDCDVVPIRVERLGRARFRLTVCEPLEIDRAAAEAAASDPDARDAMILDIMTRANAIVEDWVRERPEQWLWPHRRWDR